MIRTAISFNFRRKQRCVVCMVTAAGEARGSRKFSNFDGKDSNILGVSILVWTSQAIRKKEIRNIDNTHTCHLSKITLQFRQVIEQRQRTLVTLWQACFDRTKKKTKTNKQGKSENTQPLNNNNSNIALFFPSFRSKATVRNRSPD